MQSIPLSIGVAGHRDIAVDAVADLTRDVADVLRQYRSTHPEVPVVVLTSLASGGDQIVARAARTIEWIRVVAVLPMPVEEYRRDFTDPQELESFDALLEDADGVLVVSDYWPDADKLQTRLAEPAIRDVAYQRCARFVSMYSHVLIALWDGQPPQFLGGTADTIHHRVPGLDGLTAPDHVAFPLGRPPEAVLHIPVMRRGRHEAPRLICGVEAPHGVWSITGSTTCDEGVPDLDDPLIHALEELNTWFRTQQPDQVSDRSVASLMNAADGLAARYQRTFRRAAAGILVLSVVSLVLISLLLNVSTPWLLLASLVFTTSVATLWWTLSRSHTKQKFQQFRALAEGARVQQVWDDVGVRRSVADVYLTYQPEVRWIRTLLRTAWLLDNSPRWSAPAPASPDPDRVEHTANTWLTGQLEYFLGRDGRPGALARNHAKAAMMMRLGVAGAVIGIAGLAPGVLASLGVGISPGWLPVAGQGMWALGLGMVAASAAYTELMAFRDISRRYAQSIEIFHQGLARLQRGQADGGHGFVLHRTQAVVEDVGVEALQETSAWFATSYDRKVRPV